MGGLGLIMVKLVKVLILVVGLVKVFGDAILQFILLSHRHEPVN